MGIQIPADYRPQENEPFMNEKQREYFRRKLNSWKEEILRESRETIQNFFKPRPFPTPIWPTGLRPKRSGSWNCVPAIGRGS